MVYKNPKKQKDDVNTALGTKGSSIMQPMAAHRGVSIVLKRGGGNDVNVNTEAFWQKKVEDVPVDQVFFHKYFTQKKTLNPVSKKAAQTAGSDEDEDDFAGSKKSRKGRGDSDDDDEDDNGSELDEDEIWNAMMSDMPKNVKDDIDDDIDDLSDADLEELMLSDLEDKEEEGSSGEAGSDEEDEEAGWKDDDGDDGDDGEVDEEASMFMDEADDMVPSDEEAEDDSDEEERGNVLHRHRCYVCVVINGLGVINILHECALQLQAATRSVERRRHCRCLHPWRTTHI